MVLVRGIASGQRVKRSTDGQKVSESRQMKWTNNISMYLVKASLNLRMLILYASPGQIADVDTALWPDKARTLNNE